MEAQLGYRELSVGKTKTKEHTSKEEKMKNKKSLSRCLGAEKTKKKK